MFAVHVGNPLGAKRRTEEGKFRTSVASFLIEANLKAAEAKIVQQNQLDREVREATRRDKCKHIILISSRAAIFGISIN